MIRSVRADFNFLDQNPPFPSRDSTEVKAPLSIQLLSIERQGKRSWQRERLPMSMCLDLPFPDLLTRSSLIGSGMLRDFLSVASL